MMFPHRVLEGAEEKAVIDDLMTRIPTLNCAGTKERWEKGWQENLEAFRKSGDVADLRPKYIRAGQPVRLNGKFVMPEAANIECLWYRKFFADIAGEWLADAERIYEFGCGSCHNVAWLARRFPDKGIAGLDWSAASGAIIEELCKIFPLILQADPFDFFNPRPVDMLTGATVLTVGALEQTGKRWKSFLEYLLAAKPAICVHIEPILDWYEPTNPVDRTAIAAHKARGFWEGFYEELRRLRGMGKVEILHVERTGFGSLFVEGYSQLIWRPL